MRVLKLFLPPVQRFGIENFTLVCKTHFNFDQIGIFLRQFDL